MPVCTQTITVNARCTTNDVEVLDPNFYRNFVEVWSNSETRKS